LEKNDDAWYRILIEEIRAHKIWKVLLVLAVSAAILFFLGTVKWEETSFPFIAKVPFGSLGEELLKMLFLVGFFEVYLRRESEIAIQSLLFSKQVIGKMLDLNQVREVMSACFTRADSKVKCNTCKPVRSADAKHVQTVSATSA
jgi:hypothetical protein